MHVHVLLGLFRAAGKSSAEALADAIWQVMFGLSAEHEDDQKGQAQGLQMCTGGAITVSLLHWVTVCRVGLLPRIARPRKHATNRKSGPAALKAIGLAQKQQQQAQPQGGTAGAGVSCGGPKPGLRPLRVLRPRIAPPSLDSESEDEDDVARNDLDSPSSSSTISVSTLLCLSFDLHGSTRAERLWLSLQQNGFLHIV